jgi:hypothetical protein
MTEILEIVAPPKKHPKPEDPKDKKPLTIRIHLLCDGTNNNRENIAAREKFELGKVSNSYKKFGKGNTAVTSYDNGRTNIAIMEPHVEVGKGKGGYSIVVKVYVEGQGTTKFKVDDTQGLAMGSGLSGVYQRARTGINEALNKLHTELFEDHPPEKYFIKQVDVDVFGFSRGAATARHAIHAITTEETMTVSGGPYAYGTSTQTYVITHPLFKRFWQLGYTETRADQIKIKFAGLYDTVVSVNASQLMSAWLANNTLDQRAVAKAEFALHLAAADEHRQDFPLHTIKSAKDAGKGAEYYLPGVHSDVGGSYNLANKDLLDERKANSRIREMKGEDSLLKLEAQKAELIKLGHKDDDVVIETTKWIYARSQPTKPIAHGGKLYVYRQISGLEYARPSDEIKRVINRGRISDLKEDMKNLKENGWYEDGEIYIDTDYVASTVRTAKIILNPLDALINGSPVSGRLITNRFGIASAYSNIPLKIMVEHSRKQQILIKQKLDQRADIILATQPALKALEDSIKKYMGAKGKTGSKPDDWLNIKTALTHHAGIKKFRNRHVHMSGRFDSPLIDPGYTPRIKNNVRKRFYYEG